MPAIDNCQPQVVRALEKSGWYVNTRPFQLKVQTRRIYIDLQAVQQINGTRQHILLVEVKCFIGLHASAELYHAIGQYLIYRATLAERAIDIPLFLAIPNVAYQRLFDAAAHRVVNESKIKLIIVDLQREEIIQWIR